MRSTVCRKKIAKNRLVLNKFIHQSFTLKITTWYPSLQPPEPHECRMLVALFKVWEQVVGPPAEYKKDHSVKYKFT